MTKIIIPYTTKTEVSFTMNSNSSEKVIREGPAEICLVNDKVFYNPVQEFNRDLSVLVLNVFLEDYKREKLEFLRKKGKINDSESEPKIEVNLLEALSATGLRSIRYAKEVPSITKIVANDISESAVKTMNINMKHNQVDHLVETSHDDACMLMYKHKVPAKRFAVIDVDPYGCPSIFLDACVQSIQDGGLLLVTATDMAILAGNAPETCYSKYGAISLRTKSCHEMALRILLQCIEQHANRYSRYIEPLLSISADFYIRVFVKVYSGAKQCKQTTSKLSMVYQCVGCDVKTLQPLGGFKPNPTDKNPNEIKAFLPSGPPVGTHCAHCNHPHKLGGPIWSAPIHSQSFVYGLLEHLAKGTLKLGTADRLDGMLSMVVEELVDVPLYYTHDKLFSIMNLKTMPMMLMRSAILNAGYDVSFSHACRVSIKTTAPSQFIWDILKTWAKSWPAHPARLESNSVAKAILSKEITSAVDLTERPDANPFSRRSQRLRFQYNPEPHWGPGSRGAVNVGQAKTAKAIRNQNKHKKQCKRPCPQGEESERKKTNISEDDAV
ncbi:hypothetical protein ACJJTC_012805 [Scirpophaga incertulas]